MKTIALLLYLLIAHHAYAETYTDPKYCGFVPRDANGDIKRSSTELKHFQMVHPCPSTGLSYGTCPGWSIDHIWPLACGGCDAIVNMQWLPLEGKSCSEDYCKDRYERYIQYVQGPVPGLNPKSCYPKIIPYTTTLTSP